MPSRLCMHCMHALEHGASWFHSHTVVAAHCSAPHGIFPIQADRPLFRLASRMQAGIFGKLVDLLSSGAASLVKTELLAVDHRRIRPGHTGAGSGLRHLEPHSWPREEQRRLLTLIWDSCSHLQPQHIFLIIGKWS